MGVGRISTPDRQPRALSGARFLSVERGGAVRAVRLVPIADWWGGKESMSFQIIDWNVSVLSLADRKWSALHASCSHRGQLEWPVGADLAFGRVAAGGDMVLLFRWGAEGCISSHPSVLGWTVAATKTIQEDAQAALGPPRSIPQVQLHFNLLFAWPLWFQRTCFEEKRVQQWLRRWIFTTSLLTPFCTYIAQPAQCTLSIAV